MNTFKIKEATLESIIIGAKNVYPNEFFSMLGGEKETITELVVVPADFGNGFASYSMDMLPFDKSIIGTVHSHPTEYAHPSVADLAAFRTFGRVHIIIAYPYNINTLRTFDNKGNPVVLEVIEDE